MTRKLTIGIDVGGTFIRAGIVNHNGHVVAHRRRHTPRDAVGESLMADVAEVVQQLVDENGGRDSAIEGIGLALPGIVDEVNGMLVRSLNLRNVEGFPVADALADRLKLPVRLMTDMRAVTWAEYTACQPAPRSFVHLRLGTGVGLCTVTDGRLERVDEARRTHHPLLVVDRGENAERCRCGLGGCLENIASARALAGNNDPEGHAAALTQIQYACETEDAKARKTIEAAAAAISKAIFNVADTYNADHISIGGGVATALPFLVNCVSELISKGRAHAPNANALTFDACRLGDKAGILGAALLAKSTSAAHPMADG